jgi:hypothetical protein
VLLRPRADAGDVFRIRIRVGGPHPPGRALVVNGGVGELARIAVPPAADPAARPHTALVADPGPGPRVVGG